MLSLDPMDVELLREADLATNPKLRLRVNQDIVTRSRPGLFVYPILWLIVSFGTHFYTNHPLLTWLIFGVFSVAGIFRFIHAGVQPKWNDERAKLWIKLFPLVVVPQSFTWGCMFTFAMLTDSSTYLFLMAFSSSGLIAGGLGGFSPNLKLAFIFVISFCAPAIIVTASITQNWPILIMIIAYPIFMLHLARQQNKEYWRSLSNEHALAKQSRTDVLTQLDNRRFFDEKLNQLCHLSSRDNSRISILLIDCDHFKDVNDQYGHDFGDECLRQLALSLRQALPRASDTCARYGGEEFSILLPATDAAGALIVAERIRKMAETNPVELSGHSVTLTVSIGVVSMRLADFTPELPAQLFKLADNALYKAKQRGRNCCVIADPIS